MKKKENATKYVRVTPDLHKKLRVKAFNLNMTISELIAKMERNFKH